MTLGDLIINITLDQLRTYLIKIFTQLSELEKTEYQLIHGDLHANNILISNNKAYIIDWGQSSFLYKGKRIRKCC
jgi:thiamine kinase-like enzyme